ncbi:hypothetical protein scyTo_0017879 [Scyliorhinus torazame]|uniref:Poly [ADP-ribose] polymerase n=1 Tax=Scyliorhinus torazame TaxID=75743 RepID=A0A401Q1Z7_SCYTO|nr:hypothetical protein [Scyliorhinus torazame]
MPPKQCDHGICSQLVRQPHESYHPPHQLWKSPAGGSHTETGMEQADPADDCVLQVHGVTDDMPMDILTLYFESKRRSGGGTITSTKRQGDYAVITFENPTDAQRVLSNSGHKFQNVELTVRRPPPNDPRKIVLRGLKPQIMDDTLILYLECVADCSSDQFTVHYGQDRIQALVHFKEALSAEALEKMKRKAGSRALQGATINIEQLPRTDRILVENISPTDDKDILSLYFESRRSDGGSVLDVTMVSPGTAIVVFQEWEAVDRVLQKCQKLQDRELLVRPYYDFLQLPSTDRECGRQTVETQAEVLAEVTSVINVPDKVKLNILHSNPFLHDLRNECSELSLTIDANNCVCVRGTDPLQIEKTKSRILEFLSQIAQVDVPISEDQAKFFSRGDIQDHLQNVLREKGLPTCFSISDGVLTVTAPSVPVAHQVAHLIEQQISQFSISISDRQLHVLTAPDWEKLLPSLRFCEARISDVGDQVCFISLKCFRAENEERVKDLLENSVSEDLVIGMEPGKLRFLQEYYQDFLAGSQQVSIFPLEGDTAGLRITGVGSACENVDELLRSIASNICSRTLTLQKPGICRFLREERGTNILKHLEIKYKCTIGLEGVRWMMLQTKHPLEIQNSQATPSFERDVSVCTELQQQQQSVNMRDANGNIPDLGTDTLTLTSGRIELIQLNEASDEYSKMVRHFYDTLKDMHNKIRIIKVEKVSNPLLYQQYMLKKASMVAAQTDVERVLYHGTSEASAKEIYVHGFNRSFCGKNATVYGQGVYFAVNAIVSIQDQYSPPNADGHKFVFVTNALTGTYTNGKSEMKTPPLKENTEMPLRYDSLVDNCNDPKIFVIFNDTQAYPQYLITCQRN